MRPIQLLSSFGPDCPGLGIHIQKPINFSCLCFLSTELRTTITMNSQLWLVNSFHNGSMWRLGARANKGIQLRTWLLVNRNHYCIHPRCSKSAPHQSNTSKCRWNYLYSHSESWKNTFNYHWKHWIKPFNAHSKRWDKIPSIIIQNARKIVSILIPLEK